MRPAAQRPPGPRLREDLARHWFVLGLAAVTLGTAVDPGGVPAAAGLWLKAHRAPEIIVSAIFLFSGARLSAPEMRRGATDLRAIGLALGAIFLAAPALAWLLGLLPVGPGVRIGLFLVAAMPTTLSSGVVMTGAAGGSEATALAITLVSNWAAVGTVPWTLEALLGAGRHLPPGALHKGALALRIALLVVLPLCAGLILRPRLPGPARRLLPRLGTVSQVLVLVMVWVGVAGSRSTLAANPAALLPAVAVSVVFHGLMWAVLFPAVRLARLGPGRREAVIFMGGQKTLPLSVLLQTILFPAYGEALVVCVVHHLAHLVMDGYLVGRLAPRRAPAAVTGGARAPCDPAAP